VLETSGRVTHAFAKRRFNFSRRVLSFSIVTLNVMRPDQSFSPGMVKLSLPGETFIPGDQTL
jgi:hypothetical protein